METELKNIEAIVEKSIGEPKKNYSIEEWHEYNCPRCSHDAGVESDGKHNLCVHFPSGTYHCWKCEDKGKLSKLIRTWGGEALLSEYYHEISLIRKSKEFRLQFNDEMAIANDYIVDESALYFPEGYRKLSRDDKYAVLAYDYLQQRNLSDYFVDKFNLGYVRWCDKDFRYGSRIIIPSYDSFGDLNYWVARDYRGKSKLKYVNPKVDKKKIVFNEGLINWYEDVTLVEGVFDHMVIPNSIPLLGKTLDNECATYKSVMENAMANVNVLLDDDAYKDALRMYKFLNNGKFKDRIRLIECPNGYDASLVYQRYGKKGILQLMRRARKVDEFDLLNI